MHKVGLAGKLIVYRWKTIQTKRTQPNVREEQRAARRAAPEKSGERVRGTVERRENCVANE